MEYLNISAARDLWVSGGAEIGFENPALADIRQQLAEYGLLERCKPFLSALLLPKESIEYGVTIEPHGQLIAIWSELDCSQLYRLSQIGHEVVRWHSERVVCLAKSVALYKAAMQMIEASHPSALDALDKGSINALLILSNQGFSACSEWKGVALTIEKMLSEALQRNQLDVMLQMMAVEGDLSRAVSVVGSITAIKEKDELSFAASLPTIEERQSAYRHIMYDMIDQDRSFLAELLIRSENADIDKEYLLNCMRQKLTWARKFYAVVSNEFRYDWVRHLISHIHNCHYEGGRNRDALLTAQYAIILAHQLQNERAEAAALRDIMPIIGPAFSKLSNYSPQLAASIAIVKREHPLDSFFLTSPVDPKWRDAAQRISDQSSSLRVRAYLDLIIEMLKSGDALQAETLIRELKAGEEKDFLLGCMQREIIQMKRSDLLVSEQFRYECIIQLIEEINIFLDRGKVAPALERIQFAREMAALLNHSVVRDAALCDIFYIANTLDKEPRKDHATNNSAERMRTLRNMR